jgi:hypothetical protein
MLKKFFAKSQEKKSELEELREKIFSMKLSDLILYIKGKMEGTPLTEEGVIFVLERLSAKINDKRYFLDNDDDDSKLKKAFDLVITISKSRQVSVKAMEQIAEFYKTYEKLIYEYDRRHKDIYSERIKKAVETAMMMIEGKAALKNKMQILE